MFDFHQWWVQISFWPGDRLPQGVVCTLHEGDDFGKLALVNDAPRAASIVLREDNCHFLRVDKEDFNRILRVSFFLPSAMKWKLLPSVGEDLAAHQQYQRCYCHLAANFILGVGKIQKYAQILKLRFTHLNFEEIIFSYWGTKGIVDSLDIPLMKLNWYFSLITITKIWNSCWNPALYPENSDKYNFLYISVFGSTFPCVFVHFK